MQDYLKETLKIDVYGKQVPVGKVKDYIDLTITETAQLLSKRLNTNRTANNWISDDMCKEFAEGVQNDPRIQSPVLSSKSDSVLNPDQLSSRTRSEVQCRKNFIRLEIKYTGTAKVFDEDSGERYNLSWDSKIEDVETIAPIEKDGKKIKEETLDKLCKAFPNGLPRDAWLKVKGNGILYFNRREFQSEIHWYQHPNVGIVWIRAKPEDKRSIPILPELKEEAVIMELNEKGNGRSIPCLERKVSHISKENIFQRYKPAMGSKVFMENGEEITSEKILKVIEGLKRCMEKGNVVEFNRFYHENPLCRSLTTVEHVILSRSILTENGITLSTLFSVIVDLL